jgi:mycothiol-dependent nitroreductase-like protein
MTHSAGADSTDSAVTIWFDPVCPFTWNTARWLKAVAGDEGLTIDWRLMSLAVLNEGQELGPKQQAHMRDSQQIGRLMAAILDKRGAADMVTAYFAFGERHFDASASIDDSLVRHVCGAVGIPDVADSVVSDETYDDALRQSHQAGQEALGESGGSPILRIKGRTFFGPVLTKPPAQEMMRAVFDALVTLAAVPEFTQLKRPKDAD